MKKIKPEWVITAVEPDKVNIKFLKNFDIKVKRSFIEKFNTNIKFDFISLNKVLEHLQNPIKSLIKIKKILKTNGILYIEVPDGEIASKHKSEYLREEFFADHNHVFSKKSITYLVRSTGYNVISIKRIIEPSKKYTVYLFLKKNDEKKN